MKENFNLNKYLKNNLLLKESASDLDPKAAARSNEKYAENPRGYVEIESDEDVTILQADAEMYGLTIEPKYTPGLEPDDSRESKSYHIMGSIDDIEDYLNNEPITPVGKIIYDKAPGMKWGKSPDDWMARSGASKLAMKDYDNETGTSKYSGYYGQGA
jgi:hypothetical protein